MLLEQREALLRGDLKALEGMADKLERELKLLPSSQPGDRTSADLFEQARRNAALLKAAQTGIQRARQTLAPPKAAQLTTYTTTGLRQAAIAPQGRVLSRR